MTTGWDDRRARLHAQWPLWATALLSLVWIPSLSRGFCDADFNVVPLTLSQFAENPLVGILAVPGSSTVHPEGRPVGTLAFVLLSSDDAYTQHAVNLLIYLTCMWSLWRTCRYLELTEWPTFLALSSLFHPAFLWNVTWIAHRYDLLVIAFLLPAIAARRMALKVVLIGLASGAKPPLFVQNIAFAVQFWRDRRIVACAFTLLWLVIFGIGVYVTRYVDEAQGVPATSVLQLPFIVAIPFRALKLLEGIVYVFAPIPVFAVGYGVPFVILGVYAVLWAIVCRSPTQSFAGSSPLKRLIVWVAVAMAVPFLYNSEVRVTGAAAVMAFLAVAAHTRIDGWRRVAVVSILVLNLAGVFLHYGMFRSTQYDIRGAIDDGYGLDGCSPYAGYPVHAFEETRGILRQHIHRVFDVREVGS